MWAAEAGARVNWQTRPALKTEAFFETIWGLAKDGKVNDKGVPTLLRVALIAREYEDVFRLASPPWAVQRLLFGSLANRYSARLPGRIPLLATRRLAGVPGKRRGAMIVGGLPDGGRGGRAHLCFPLRAGLAPSTWLLGRLNGFTTQPTRTPIHHRSWKSDSQKFVGAGSP